MDQRKKQEVFLQWITGEDVDFPYFKDLPEIDTTELESNLKEYENKS